MENIKVGDRVRFVDEAAHLELPEYYPSVGTIGKVIRVVDDESLIVKWPYGSTSGDGEWYCEIAWLELVTEGG